MNALLGSWWRARSMAERRTLGAGGVLLALLLVVGGVILPLIDQHHALAQRLPALRASTEALEAQADEAIALRARVGAAPSVAPAATLAGGPAGVRASLEAAGLYAAGDSVQAQGDGQLEIRLASADFDAFLAWLARTPAAAGLRPLSLEADALAGPGRVRLHCVLTVAGGPA